jgi:hypothetical protein
LLVKSSKKRRRLSYFFCNKKRSKNLKPLFNSKLNLISKKRRNEIKKFKKNRKRLKMLKKKPMKIQRGL